MMATASSQNHRKCWIHCSFSLIFSLVLFSCTESDSRPKAAPLLDLASYADKAQEQTLDASDDLSDGVGVVPTLSDDIGLCLLKESRKILIQSPVYVHHFDLDTLGIVEIQSSDRRCIEASIEDGGEIIAQSEEQIRLFYPKRFDAFISETIEKVDVERIEGRWNDIQERIVPGINGRRVNAEATRANFLTAVHEQADSFELVIDKFQAFSSQVDEDKFEPKHKIGEYQTVFSRSRNRTSNVKLAASALNGIFLMPGAEFSYNNWVGERSEARGYKEAPVIENGQLVEGLGGGACQVSSTVYAAALLSGMAIVERYNHSLPSSYIPTGMDAVVSYPILDLRIKNRFERPVVLRVSTEDNVLTAQFFSDKEIDKRFLFRREVIEELPYKEIITVDPKLEAETVKISKRGKLGYRVQRGRISWIGDEENYERLNIDTYQAQDQHVSIAIDVIYPPPGEDGILPNSLLLDESLQERLPPDRL